VRVEVVAKLLEFDLVLVSEASLFLRELVVSFEAGGIKVGVEGLLDLKLGGLKFGLERVFGGCKFRVEGVEELFGFGCDFVVEESALLVNAFFDEFAKLLVDGVLAGLIG
jgi:hypothetical protein